MMVIAPDPPVTIAKVGAEAVVALAPFLAPNAEMAAGAAKPPADIAQADAAMAPDVLRAPVVAIIIAMMAVAPATAPGDELTTASV